jgi:NarL family two-component system response regulator LiaR
LEKIKILIADDHAFVREGTRRILEQEPDLEVVAEAGDGEEAVRLASDLKPDVAIIDVAMPKLDGLLEAGAAGYLLKSVRGHEIVDAIRAVDAGESVLHPSVARKVLNRFASVSGKAQRKKPLELLTDREMEVLKLVTKGLSNKDIADGLSLSVRTVQGHLANIFNKLRVGSRTEAVVHALKEGWVTLDDVS